MEMIIVVHYEAMHGFCPENWWSWQIKLLNESDGWVRIAELRAQQAEQRGKKVDLALEILCILN